MQCLAPEGSWLRRQEGKPGLARFVSVVEPPRPFAEGDVPHAIREGLASHQSVVGLCATANGKHSEGSSQPEAQSPSSSALTLPRPSACVLNCT